MQRILVSISDASQKISSDQAFSFGGFCAGMISYWQHINIGEWISFSAHAIVGGLISYGIKHSFEWAITKFIKKEKQK
jgi:hypothetical protein